MLTENTWTEKGLVNGALGTMRSLHWGGDSVDIDKQVPTVLVQFDKYDGPLLEQFEDYPVVPIRPSRREFAVGSNSCTRTQVPLTVVWAITIHKSQGITADRIVTNIAEKDHVPGLTYVAVSRVKKLQGIMFEAPFDYARFKGAATKTETMRSEDYFRRLPQHVPPVIPGLPQ